MKETWIVATRLLIMARTDHVDEDPERSDDGANIVRSKCEASEGRRRRLKRRSEGEEWERDESERRTSSSLHSAGNKNHDNSTRRW